MYLKVCVLLMALVLSQANPQIDLSENRLMTLMLEDAISRQDPQRKNDCFNYYMPLINELGIQYQGAYQHCLHISEQAHAEVDCTIQKDRTQIDDVAKEICGTTSTCSEHTNSIEFFECYRNASVAGEKSMLRIKEKSVDLLAEVREQYRFIDVDQDFCTTKAKRANKEQLDNIYAELEKCLKGVIPVPTTTTPAP
ncbi:uncharacterized protein LOC117792497 isoform X2 [Drosophila innubila]|uniref:uncharacterized protein LOC117792497 isoform X2 n=1 Tax=Drosophila innubila TaxID=198719 RepID=UPI00148E84A2|nr:uncharacterized protein LOC117792497 isoform X2 [Drosophila innubila]